MKNTLILFFTFITFFTVSVQGKIPPPQKTLEALIAKREANKENVTVLRTLLEDIKNRDEKKLINTLIALDLHRDDTELVNTLQLFRDYVDNVWYAKIKNSATAREMGVKFLLTGNVLMLMTDIIENEISSERIRTVLEFTMRRQTAVREYFEAIKIQDSQRVLDIFQIEQTLYFEFAEGKKVTHKFLESIKNEEDLRRAYFLVLLIRHFKAYSEDFQGFSFPVLD